MTLQEVLDDIVHKLDWRGPSGRSQGHIVLSREEAATLVSEISGLQLKLEAARDRELELFTKLNSIRERLLPEETSP
jgi:hypothetical protein